jgi:hypothetical protein
MNGTADLSGDYKLTADIDLTGLAQTPISGFTGTFDGDGHTITGLKQKNSASATIYGGLVGCVDGATIRRLGMVASNISAENAGGVAGWAINATIGECYNAGTVSGVAFAGGVAGVIDGTTTISDCYSIGAVTATEHAGGIAGSVCGNSINSRPYIRPLAHFKGKEECILPVLENAYKQAMGCLAYGYGISVLRLIKKRPYDLVNYVIGALGHSRARLIYG